MLFSKPPLLTAAFRVPPRSVMVYEALVCRLSTRVVSLLPTMASGTKTLYRYISNSALHKTQHYVRASSTIAAAMPAVVLCHTHLAVQACTSSSVDTRHRKERWSGFSPAATHSRPASWLAQDFSRHQAQRAPSSTATIAGVQILPPEYCTNKLESLATGLL